MTPLPPSSQSSDPLAGLLAAQATLSKLPPMPRCIMAHHSVPYGRAYRQWNTRGDLIVWANRGEIEDIPRLKHDPEDAFRMRPLLGLGGIPVMNA